MQNELMWLFYQFDIGMCSMCGMCMWLPFWCRVCYLSSCYRSVSVLLVTSYFVRRTIIYPIWNIPGARRKYELSNRLYNSLVTHGIGSCIYVSPCCHMLCAFLHLVFSGLPVTLLWHIFKLLERRGVVILIPGQQLEETGIKVRTIPNQTKQ